MKNVQLQKGICPICGDEITVDFAGRNPSLGTMCRKCSYINPEPKVFTPECVELKVKKNIHFDPLLGIYEYVFDWKGTKVTVNNCVGIVHDTQGDLAWVTLLGQNTVPINGLGYWDILDIYKQTGKPVQPPAFPFIKQRPLKKVDLLEKPVFNLEIGSSQKGNLYVLIKLDDFDVPFEFINTLQAFCNFYIRWKYDLMPNFFFEGGVSIRGSDVRNILSHTQGVIYTHGLNAEIFSENQTDKVREILAEWAKIMTVLLRYNWREKRYKTLRDIWDCHLTMQNVLLNVLSEEEIRAVIEFAQGNKTSGCGVNY